MLQQLVYSVYLKININNFLKFFYNLYTQCGAPPHLPKIKSLTFFLMSQPGTPQ